MNDFLAVNFHLQFGSQACPDLYLSPPTSSLTYNDANELLTEAYSGAGSVLAGLSVTNGYDQFARRTNVVVLNSSSSVLVRATNSYDAVSRLAVIGDGGANFATYTYVANSPLVSQIVFKQNATTSMTTTKSYDFLNRLLSISSTNSPLPSPTRICTTTPTSVFDAPTATEAFGFTNMIPLGR